MNTRNPAIDSVYTTTKGLSGSDIIPLNNILGTTAGINDILQTEAIGYTFDPNNPFAACEEG